jgi:hypothetical protein
VCVCVSLTFVGPLLGSGDRNNHAIDQTAYLTKASELMAQLPDAHLVALKVFVVDRNTTCIGDRNSCRRQSLSHMHVRTQYLIQFLKVVASYSDENKMSPANLAIVFGPTLVRPRVDTVENSLDTPLVIQFVESLIDDWVMS